MKKVTPFSTLKLLHSAMLFGQVFFIAIVIYLVYAKHISPPMQAQDKELQVIALLFTAAAIFGGGRLFKKKLAEVQDESLTVLKERLTKYRAACIIQWALLEAAVLLCGTCFLLTGNYAFLALAAVPLFVFAMRAPVKEKIAGHLQVNSGELDEL